MAYTNAALVLLKAAVGLLLQRPELVCVCCREALEIRRDCPKALYRLTGYSATYITLYSPSDLYRY